jgi:hypothetical protein
MMPAPRRLRQKDCEFKANLYYTVRHCLKKTKTDKKQLEKLAIIIMLAHLPFPSPLPLLYLQQTI